MATQTHQQFSVGSTVCLIDYSNECEVHTGTVTAVKVERNGYRTTTVNLPTFRGERVYATENLLKPESVESAVEQHKRGLVMWKDC